MKYVYDFYHYLIETLRWIYVYTQTQLLYFLLFENCDIIQEKCCFE